MRFEFTVDGLPPKKDGANSMWGKASEAGSIRALRLAAAEALSGSGPLRQNIKLGLRIHVGPHRGRSVGDLDNFVTGVCDGLQPADPRSRIAIEFEEHIGPSVPVGIVDDCEVIAIDARKVTAAEPLFYEVVLEGD